VTEYYTYYNIHNGVGTTKISFVKKLPEFYKNMFNQWFRYFIVLNYVSTIYNIMHDKP